MVSVMSHHICAVLTHFQGFRERSDESQIQVFFYPCKVDEEGSLTDEASECKHDQPIIPSQTFDHISSDKEAQSGEEDCEGQEGNRDGNQSSSVGWVAFRFRRTLGIPVSVYYVGFHFATLVVDRSIAVSNGA